MSDPAFPQHSGCYIPGLTKREYFAIRALQGILVDKDMQGAGDTIVAECAVQMADALIRELEKPHAPT